MTDTSTLSGYLLDYYTALAENMPNPKLVKHQRGDEYICIVGKQADCGLYYSIDAYSPTTNPALALPIIDIMLSENFCFINDHISDAVLCGDCLGDIDKIAGKDITEAALRALVAWKFPDGLPEPVYESEK